jgi:hypothetical protein
MPKCLVQGRDAEKVLNNIWANDMAIHVGKIGYTQWFNERGGIEADLTVTRLAQLLHLGIGGWGLAAGDGRGAAPGRCRCVEESTGVEAGYMRRRSSPTENSMGEGENRGAPCRTPTELGGQ